MQIEASNKKSKKLFSIFFLVVMISIVATYYRYVIIKDFKITTDQDAFNESLLENQ